MKSEIVVGKAFDTYTKNPSKSSKLESTATYSTDFGPRKTEMTKMLLYSKVLAAVILPITVQGVKIAFVGDTGMDGT